MIESKQKIKLHDLQIENVTQHEHPPGALVHLCSLRQGGDLMVCELRMGHGPLDIFNLKIVEFNFLFTLDHFRLQLGESLLQFHVWGSHFNANLIGEISCRSESSNI